MKLIKFNGNALLRNDKLIRKNDLADNTWAEIMQQILDGTAPSRWVGQSKLVNIGGVNYYALCVDNTYGRYQKADGTYTTLTFVISKAIGTLLGGGATQTIATTKRLYPTTTCANYCLNFINDRLTDNDLKSVIQKVKSKCSNIDGSGYSDYTNMVDFESEFFNPAISELTNQSANQNNAETTSYLNGNELGRYQYMLTHTLDDGGQVKGGFWTRSLSYYNTNAWYFVQTNGTASAIGGEEAKSNFCIAFAL